MKITLIDMVAKGVKYAVPSQKVVTLGRNQSNMIVIPDIKYRDSLGELERTEFDEFAGTISRQHCTIYQEPGKEPYVSDGISTRGTMVDGLILNKDMRANLKNGTKLKLGLYELVVKIE